MAFIILEYNITYCLKTAENATRVFYDYVELKIQVQVLIIITKGGEQ